MPRVAKQKRQQRAASRARNDLASESTAAARLERPIGPQATPEGAASAHAHTAASLASTRDVRNLALSIPCDEHGSPVNVYCFVSVKGLCRPRIDAAVVLVNARAEADS